MDMIIFFFDKMTDMIVNIIVVAIDILGTATKEMKQSRANEFILYLRSFEAYMCAETFLKIAGITKLEGGLKKLDKMQNEEARMANAELMWLAYDINKKVEGIDEKVLGVEGNVKVVENKVQTVMDGAKMYFDLLSTLSLILNFPDGKQAAVTLQNVAYDGDDAKRSSSVSFLPTAGYLT